MMWSYAVVSTVFCSYLVQIMSNIHSINRCSIFYHPDFKGQPLNLFHTIQIIWKKIFLFKPFCCAHYYTSISLLCKYEWSSTSHRALKMNGRRQFWYLGQIEIPEASFLGVITIMYQQHTDHGTRGVQWWMAVREV